MISQYISGPCVKYSLLSFWMTLHILALTYFDSTQTFYFLFATYRQRNWLNHFGHLGLRRGLTSRWIGHPSSTLLRGSESPYLVFALFLDCWSWVDFSCGFPPTASHTYIILIFVCW
ncbi:hypothetical protein B0H13DRAFT_2056221 [Mycena leptocephala]|nr:hypothetical protein B0H13DRAFT_2108487 [Mycena leptocephala]KAJ7875797.1 hypothetical protein B0H13DRAFT_2056221 [Mycena leptocephala]